MGPALPRASAESAGVDLPNDGLLDHEVGHVQVVVVLGIRDGAGERLSYEAGCFLRGTAQQIQGVRSRKPLDFPCNLPGLKGRNSGETVCRSNLHLWCFFVEFSRSAPGIHLEAVTILDWHFFRFETLNNCSADTRAHQSRGPRRCAYPRATPERACLYARLVSPMPANDRRALLHVNDHSIIEACFTGPALPPSALQEVRWFCVAPFRRPDALGDPCLRSS